MRVQRLPISTAGTTAVIKHPNTIAIPLKIMSKIEHAKIKAPMKIDVHIKQVAIFLRSSPPPVTFSSLSHHRTLSIRSV